LVHLHKKGRVSLKKGTTGKSKANYQPTRPRSVGGEAREKKIEKTKRMKQLRQKIAGTRTGSVCHCLELDKKLGPREPGLLQITKKTHMKANLTRGHKTQKKNRVRSILKISEE